MTSRATDFDISFNLRVQIYFRLSFVFPETNGTVGNRSAVPVDFTSKLSVSGNLGLDKDSKGIQKFCRKQFYLNNEEKRDVYNQFVNCKTSNL